MNALLFVLLVAAISLAFGVVSAALRASGKAERRENHESD